MGTPYVLIDAEGRNGLDIDKAHALAVAAGCVESDRKRLLTLDMVRESAKGWRMEWGAGFPGKPPTTMEDVKFSVWIARHVERWMTDVAQGRPVFIVRSGAHSVPWGRETDPKPWGTLWTLYVHPVHRPNPAPPWILFPRDFPEKTR